MFLITENIMKRPVFYCVCRQLGPTTCLRMTLFSLFPYPHSPTHHLFLPAATI